VNYRQKWTSFLETRKLSVFANPAAAAAPLHVICYLLDILYEICRVVWTCGRDRVYQFPEDKKMNSQNIGISVRLNTSFDEALTKIKAALTTEGFGVLTEINVKETMKKKLDIEYPPYMILGACNPGLANRALNINPQIGLLLPCNVTVRQVEDGQIEISMIDPMIMMSGIDHPELEKVASEARRKFENIARVLENEKDA
jgi:uncharacterized protein (DUF302 family)